MSQFGSVPLVQGQDLFVTGTTATAGFPTCTLGQYAETSDGRGFRYAQAGATALAVGKLQQTSAENTLYENLSPVAAAAGATSITIQDSFTVAANALTGGQLVVTVAPGAGYSYRIASNTVSLNGSASVVIKVEDPIVVALTPTSKLDAAPSIYAGAVVNPTTATGIPIGVAVSAIPAFGYGWLQTHGVATVLAQGALTVGSLVGASTTTAGALVVTATFAGSTTPLGIAVTGVATTEYGQVFLTID